MITRNPFPGMNPFFEQCWRDAHARLIAYICDDLQTRLPADLLARAEEGVAALTSQEGARTYRPDVRVTEPWQLKEGAPAGSFETTMAADVPLRVLRNEETERWVEVRDVSGRLITVIELLSPTNKIGAGTDDYYRKRRTFMTAGANVVEVDLIREGSSIFPDPVLRTIRQAAASAVCVFRAAQPAAHEVYPIALRTRLPAIRVPLRESDADVVLNLQPLIDQCHERGRYHMLDYRTDPDPPFSPDDAAWIDNTLRQAGLR